MELILQAHGIHLTQDELILADQMLDLIGISCQPHGTPVSVCYVLQMVTGQACTRSHMQYLS